MFEIEYEVKNEKYLGLQNHPRLRNHYFQCISPIWKPEGKVSKLYALVTE
jgi:hypothetical protein